MGLGWVQVAEWTCCAHSNVVLDGELLLPALQWIARRDPSEWPPRRQRTGSEKVSREGSALPKRLLSSAEQPQFRSSARREQRTPFWLGVFPSSFPVRLLSDGVT